MIDLKSGCFEAMWLFIWNLIKNSFVYKLLTKLYGKISTAWKNSRIAGWFRTLHINEDALGKTFFGKMVRSPFTFIEFLQKKYGKALNRGIENSGVLNLCRMYLNNIIALNTRFFGILGVTFAIGSMIGTFIACGGVNVLMVVLAVIGVVLSFFNVNITEFLKDSALVKLVSALLGVEAEFDWFKKEYTKGRGRLFLIGAISLVLGLVCGKFGIVLLAPVVIIGVAVGMLAVCKPAFAVCLVLFGAPILPTMVDVALVLTAILSLIIHAITTEGFKFKFDGIGFFVIAFMVVYLVAGLSSFAMMKSISIWLIYVAFMAIYFVIINSVNSKKTLNNMLTVFVLSGLAVCLYGIAQYVFGWNTNQAWMDEEMFTDIKMRIYSTLDNPNVLGEYILLVLPVSIGLMWTRKNFYTKVVYAGISAIMLVALILTFSRGCWIGLIIAAAVFITFAAGKLWGLALVALPVIPMVLPESIINRFLSIGDMKDSSTSYRVYIWMGCLAMIKDFWLSGIGMGQEAFTQVYPFYSYNGIVAPHSHNLFLQILVESGVAGIAVFLIIVALFLRRVMTGYQYGGKGDTLSTVMTAITAGVCGFLVQGMFDNCFYNYRVMLVFWCVIALGRACVYVAKQGSEQKI